jgi:hypothetical protein
MTEWRTSKYECFDGTRSIYELKILHPKEYPGSDLDESEFTFVCTVTPYIIESNETTTSVGQRKEFKLLHGPKCASNKLEYLTYIRVFEELYKKWQSGSFDWTEYIENLPLPVHYKSNLFVFDV